MPIVHIGQIKGIKILKIFDNIENKLEEGINEVE